MAKTTDLTGLQFRMLNLKKGPAVWAPRAQCDKKAYQFRMKWVCEREPNLDFRQAQIEIPAQGWPGLWRRDHLGRSVSRHRRWS